MTEFISKEWGSVKGEHCRMCGATPAEASHYQGPGSFRLGKCLGKKLSVILILPLCRKCHYERDNKKVAKWSFEALQIDWEYLILTFIFIIERLASGEWELRKVKK